MAEAKDTILSIRIQYKGEEETIEFTGALIDRLELEAEFRHLRIDELVRESIITTMKKGLLQLVLVGSHKRAMRVPKDVLKLLAWLEGGRVSEAEIVEAGLNHTLDKALMRNFAEMNLREATVSITARGRDALSKFPVTRPRTSPCINDNFLVLRQETQSQR